jgi:hypothetical protein
MRLTRSKPNKLHKESVKQKVGALKRLTNLSQHDKMEEGKTQINKIRDEKGDITINTNEIQRIIREYFKNLHSQVNWKI